MGYSFINLTATHAQRACSYPSPSALHICLKLLMRQSPNKYHDPLLDLQLPNPLPSIPYILFIPDCRQFVKSPYHGLSSSYIQPPQFIHLRIPRCSTIDDDFTRLVSLNPWLNSLQFHPTPGVQYSINHLLSDSSTIGHCVSSYKKLSSNICPYRI